MEKSMGILLMAVLGITGMVAAVLAWFCPSLNLDKIEAPLAGIIGGSFTIFQSIRFKHSSHDHAEPVSVEIKAED